MSGMPVQQQPASMRNIHSQVAMRRNLISAILTNNGQPAGFP